MDKLQENEGEMLVTQQFLQFVQCFFQHVFILLQILVMLI